MVNAPRSTPISIRRRKGFLTCSGNIGCTLTSHPTTEGANLKLRRQEKQHIAVNRITEVDSRGEDLWSPRPNSGIETVGSSSSQLGPFQTISNRYISTTLSLKSILYERRVPTLRSTHLFLSCALVRREEVGQGWGGQDIIWKSLCLTLSLFPSASLFPSLSLCFCLSRSVCLPFSVPLSLPHFVSICLSVSLSVSLCLCVALSVFLWTLFPSTSDMWR